MKNVFLIFKTLMKMIADAICWMLCCHLTYLIIRWFTATPIYDDPSERKEKLSNWNTLFIAISLRIIIWLWWEIYEAWNIKFEILQKDNCNFAILLMIKMKIRDSISHKCYELTRVTDKTAKKWQSVWFSFHLYFTLIFILIS